MLPSEILQRVTVRIECKTLTGSGCLFQPDTDEFTYVLTAKHCLIKGEDDSPPRREEITIACNAAVQSSNLSVLDYYLDENLDLALIRIEYVPGVPLLRTAVAKDDVSLKIRGFPTSYGREAVLLNASFVEKQDNIISLRTEVTLDTFEHGARDNVRGFSGAGIYIQYNDDLYLTGVLTDLGNPEGTFNLLKGLSTEAFSSIVENNLLPKLPSEYLPRSNEVAALDLPLASQYFVDQILENLNRAILSNQAQSGEENKSIEVPGEIYTARIDQARDLIKEGKAVAALSLLRKLEDELVDVETSTYLRFRLLTNVGASLLYVGDDLQAAPYFEQALEYAPQDPKAIANAGLAAMLQGDFEQAIRLAGQALEIQPGHSSALSVLPQALAKAEKLDTLDVEIKASIEQNVESRRAECVKHFETTLKRI